MSSSSNEPLLPAEAPLYATNSWVISRSRALINYDKYDAVAQWLDEVTDEEGEKIDAGKALSRSERGPDQVRVLCGHAAGELEDYDSDCCILSPNTIVERLEAVAAEMEARHHEDNNDDSHEYRDDDSSSSSSLLSYYYSLASGSLETESILIGYKDPNFIKEANSGTMTNGNLDQATTNPILGRNRPLPSTLDSGAMPGKGMKANPSRSTDESLNKVSPTQNGVRSNVTSKPPKRSKLSTLLKAPKTKTPFLTAPQPQHGKSSREAKPSGAFVYPFTYGYPAAYPEIERGPSPLPRVRTPRLGTPFPPSSSVAQQMDASSSGASPESTKLSGGTSPARPSTPPTQDPVSGHMQPAAAPETEMEILAPVPRRVGRLFAPRPSWARFWASSFGRGRGGGK
ncbi:hypothetical protein GGS24DRAFT_516682 [Hypoxylon argillaceum]|nr:hypothetical protein GGS24DRAFT_516682 [Hypoxylon argillaceum]